MIADVEHTLQIASRPFIVSFVNEDWSNAHFTLTPEEYDMVLLEPIHLPSIRSLAVSSLLTDGGKARMCTLLSQSYIRSVEALLKEQKYTECGGLWLKRWVSRLQEEFSTYLGDESAMSLDMRKLQLFSYIMSVPRDVSDVNALCESAQIHLSKEELQEMSLLRL